MRGELSRWAARLPGGGKKSLSDLSIAVGVSGGVDSAVSVHRLLEAGVGRVLGVHMQNWSADEERATARGAGVPSGCTGQDDLVAARRVCDALGIEMVEANFEREYWLRVFDPFLKAYAAGRTPNPDVLCNRHVKFDCFLEHCRSRLGVDGVATGHYVRTFYEDDAAGDVPPALLCGVDPVKDQSYFLSMVDPEALRHAVFPVGGMLKSDVRAVAASLRLPNAARPDSMGICFIGKRPMAEFLLNYLDRSPGGIVDLESGAVLGEHRGLFTFTIGQRVRLPGRTTAHFVCAKDAATNRLLVVPAWNHPALFTDSLRTGPLRWLVPPALRPPPGVAVRVQFRTHHPSPDADGTLTVTADGVSAELRFDLPRRAIALGQGPASSGLRRGYVLSTSPLNPALRVFEDDASQRSDEAEAAVAARVSAAVSGVGGYEEALDAQGMGTGVRVVRTAAKPEPRPNAPSLGAPVRVAVDWLAAGADGARFPFSHELLLAGHGGRPALAVAAEPSGARLCSGGGDREVHLYDLAGLDAASRQPFARVVPEDGHAVVALAYGGALLAVACDSPTPHLLDRASGERKAALARGDMYLRDARRTGGHTLGVRALAWNPAPEAAGDLATAGADGTLRLWDVSRPQKSLEVAVLPALGARAHVSACAYSPNGALVAAGCDRVAAVYPGRRGAAMNLARPRYLPPPLPHPVAALAFSPREPYLLAARDVAGVLHMFDLRSIDRGPLASCDGFPSRAGDVAGALLWSPDGDFVAAPHAFSDPAGSGAVVGALSVLAAPSLEPVRRVAVAAAEATCAAWCAATRQLVVGAADGSVRVLYDPVRSERGALLVRSRAPKRASAGAVSASVLVDTPLVRRSQRPPDATAVREAAAASGAARKLAKSSAPAKPLEGRGHGGALGQSHRGSLLHGLAAENAGDAREAFLAAAERAAADPVFTRGTAPSVLDYGVDDDDAVEDGPVDGSLGERSDDYVPTAMDELARKRFKGD